MRRLRPDPVLGDVVRARLATLAEEINPRRAQPGDPRDPPGADGPDGSGPGAPPWPDSGDGERPPEGTRSAEGAQGPAAGHIRGGTVLARAWEFGRVHVAVIGVIGLVGILAAVWSLTQARTVPVAAANPVPVTATAAATSTPSPSPTPEPVRVHVLGAVARPGVVGLPPGSRVEDAIAAAGGLAPDARPGDLNLAAVVADGAQVVIGDSGDPGGEVRGQDAGGGAGGGAQGGGAGSGGGAGQLDLNRATAAELEQLPGIGPVTAGAIIAWRDQHGRFTRPEELQEVDGIGPKTWQRLAPHVRV